VVVTGLRVVAAIGVVALTTVGPAVVADASSPSTTAPPTSQQHQAGIVNFDFQLPSETITAGDTIVFTNHADRPHTVTDRGGTFDTGHIEPGTTGQITLDVPGRYEFFCNINPSTMNGVIVVQPGPGAQESTRVQTFDEFRQGETRRFDPANLRVDLGTQLVVANVGGLQHTFTARGGAFDTGTIQPGGESGRFAGTNAEVTLDKVGTFHVFCRFFPDQMQATVTVVDEQATTTTTEAPTTTSTERATTTTAAAAGGRSPPGSESAASYPPTGGNGRGIGGAFAAAGLVALGLATVLIALVPKGGGPKKPSEPVLEEF
jgi:plastocyanin